LEQINGVIAHTQAQSEEVVKKCTYAIDRLREQSWADTQNTQEEQRKAQSHLDRIQVGLSERVAELQLQIQQLNAGLERSASFQQKFEAVNWLELREILDILKEQSHKDDTSHRRSSRGNG
jgi:hypothetical protein